MSEHTPGPWHGAEQRHRDATFAICQSGYRVASVHLRNSGVPPFEPDSEQHANARLIAAAPELLAALKRLVAHDEAADAREGLREFPAAELEWARDVIDRAEGR